MSSNQQVFAKFSTSKLIRLAVLAFFSLVFLALIVAKKNGGIQSFFNSSGSSFEQATTMSDVDRAAAVDSIVSSNQSLPSPVPFADLTIPFLREHSYESELSELQPIDRNSEYVTYLTSYNSDGLKINALLTQPTGQMPEGGWPAVVFVHGYIPPSQYQTRERYQAYVDSLARNELVVLKIDLRGHGDSEGEASGAYYSGDYVIDTLNARAALQASSFVNPQKIGLWGHSMAGNVVLRSLVVEPEIPAVVIWAGAVFTYSDLQEFGISDQSYRRPSDDSPRRQRRQDLFDTYGQFDPENEFWRQVIPTNYLSEVQGAIQLHYAVDDSVVSVEYGRNLSSLLDQTEVAHELYEYSQGGHNITGNSFNLAMQRSAEFFQRYLN